MNMVGIRRLDWPAQIPDLNLTEHLWDVIKRHIRSVHPAPDNTRELKAAIKTAWERIPQQTIITLSQSMPRRVKAVPLERGGHTRYLFIVYLIFL